MINLTRITGIMPQIVKPERATLPNSGRTRRPLRYLVPVERAR